MRITETLLCSTVLLLPCLSAPAREPSNGANTNPAKAVIQMPIIHFDSVQTGILPLVDVGMGNPPQTVRMIIDTGSSDLIVAETGSAVCKDPQQQCTKGKSGLLALGSFDPSKSKGLTKAAGETLNARFGTGEAYQGPMVKDVVTLGQSQIPGTEFGLMEKGTIPPNTPSFSVFGVGPVGNEGASKQYVNVPAHMKEAGTISKNAYGVYLNDFRGSDGSITFGGLDTAKFDGKLQDVPLIRNNDGKFAQFVVSFSSMSVSGAAGGGVTKGPKSRAREAAAAAPPTKNAAVAAGPRSFLTSAVPALLDTGNPAIDLPVEAVTGMAKALGAKTRQDRDVTLLGSIPCSKGADTNVVFGFDDDKVKMSVPLSLLMRPAGGKDAAAAGQCTVPQVVGVKDLGLASIGSPFLQAMYAVFDADSNKISLAQAKFNVTESQVAPF